MQITERSTGTYTTPVDAACLIFMAWNTLIQLQDPVDSDIHYQTEMIAELISVTTSRDFETEITNTSGVAAHLLEREGMSARQLRAELTGVLEALLDNLEARHNG